jgi:hypothetical protein
VGTLGQPHLERGHPLGQPSRVAPCARQGGGAPRPPDGRHLVRFGSGASMKTAARLDGRVDGPVGRVGGWCACRLPGPGTNGQEGPPQAQPPRTVRFEDTLRLGAYCPHDRDTSDCRGGMCSGGLCRGPVGGRLADVLRCDGRGSRLIGPLGIACEATGGEAAGRLAAPAHAPGVADDGGAGTDGSGEAAAVRGGRRGAGPSAAGRSVRARRRPQRLDRPAGAFLAGVCLDQCGHELISYLGRSLILMQELCGYYAGFLRLSRRRCQTSAHVSSL